MSVKLVNNNKVIEDYGIQTYNQNFVINRFANNSLSFYEKYFFNVTFTKGTKEEKLVLPIKIEPSIIIKSFCVTKDCNINTGHVVQQTLSKIKIETYKIAPIKIIYTFLTPYKSFEIINEFNSPVNNDYVENVFFDNVPEEVSFYVATLKIYAVDESGNEAETVLPFKVVRPVQVNHYGKSELAEVYEPVPVTGCIPGSVGNRVQYSETESETRQNSLSITYNKDWSTSSSINIAESRGEGISVGETRSTTNTSSLSESTSNSESYNNVYGSTDSSNISYSTLDGEVWSWNLNETNASSNANTNSETRNTTIDGRVTTGFSGEGSLPFLAKASGKVEVSAGVSVSQSNTDSSTNTTSNSNSRGYSSGGTLQNNRSYGSISSSNRSHSLGGSYIMSSSATNTITNSSGQNSGRVWNMSETISSGNVVTTGNSESISDTLVTSKTSSTTISNSGYIPRGRFGIFFRQTSRYVKLSEIITYNLNGEKISSGIIMMNNWKWSSVLSISNSCNEALSNDLPSSKCIIQPCN